jgi:uncharacterized protein
LIDSVWKLVGLVAVATGIAGLAVPVLPGPLLIWLGTAAWAFGDGFQRVGLPTLAAMGVLAVLAETADLVITSWSARRSGVPWRSILAGMAGSLVGGVLATIPGAVIGAIVGLAAAEAHRFDGDWSRARPGVKAYLTGCIVAGFVQVILGAGMVGLFLLQVFSAP